MYNSFLPPRASTTGLSKAAKYETARRLSTRTYTSCCRCQWQCIRHHSIGSQQAGPERKSISLDHQPPRSDMQHDANIHMLILWTDLSISYIIGDKYILHLQACTVPSLLLPQLALFCIAFQSLTLATYRTKQQCKDNIQYQTAMQSIRWQASQKHMVSAAHRVSLDGS